ncbi:MAG: hypothetical protein HY508_09490 [Acidobacteria bacterium]|nr:hypothetical protein [Acidobacteriota bacterium]
MISKPKSATASTVPPTLLLVMLGGGIGGIFFHLSRHSNPKSFLPETIGLLLAAGVLYVIAAYIVERYPLGWTALAIILGAALAFRFSALSTEPALSSDVYRYQWEGRVQRAAINPYTAHPEALKHLALEDPPHPLDTGRSTPTLYPPLSEWSFSWVRTIPGYKRLYTGLDVASMAVLLLLLKIRKQPRARVLMYAWNPGVVVAFAMCGHHDSLAILALLAANLFIIRKLETLSIFFLALSFLSKFFAGLFLPLFLKRTGWAQGGLFLAMIAAAYVPYASAGSKLLDGLVQYAAGWENNDSLYRLFLLAGNSKAQAGLISGILLAALLAYVLKRRLEPLHAGLVLMTGLLLLSPNAFPWYFTWVIPFLCFYPHPPLLLLSVTCVLGYSPLVAYAAGEQYTDLPLIMVLEYAPVLLWLSYLAARQTGNSKIENRV